MLAPLRTAGLRDVIVPGLIDNDGPAPMFRAAATDVYLEAGEDRMLRLERAGDALRLSLVTDYAIPAGRVRACYRPVAYRRYIGNRIRAGNATLP